MFKSLNISRRRVFCVSRRGLRQVMFLNGAKKYVINKFFAYGTLEIPQIMECLLHARFDGGPAQLNDYARFLFKNRPYPGIVPEKNAVTAGVLYRGLSPRHIKALDDYEDSYYRRCLVRVMDYKGGNVLAWTYVVREMYRRFLSESVWDRTYFEQHLMRQYLNKLIV